MLPGLFIFTDSMDHLVSAMEEEESLVMDLPNYISQVNPDYRELEISPREISTLQGYQDMNSKNMTARQASINVLILSLLSIAAGWVGILLKNWTGNANLALLTFLTVPPLGILIVSVFYTEKKLDLGMQINLKRNRGLYLFTFLIVPLLVTLILITGSLAGWITFNGFIVKGVGAYLGAVVIFLFSNFIKNCLEELTWRGFFSRQFEAAGIPAMLNHLLTGTVWTLWHVPYWIFLLDQTTILQFSFQNKTTLIFLSALFLLASSVLFGEIRLLSGSTWPAILLHAILDAATIPLIVKGFVAVKPSISIWFSPDRSNVAFILLLFGTGTVLYSIRKKKGSVAD